MSTSWGSPGCHSADGRSTRGGEVIATGRYHREVIMATGVAKELGIRARGVYGRVPMSWLSTGGCQRIGYHSDGNCVNIAAGTVS